MEAFLFSTGFVALAEIGDKTQLLALLLAARFKRPLPIIAGIFVATVLNHAMAAWLGSLVSGWISPEVLRWGVVVSFAAVAAWALVPDKLDEDEVKPPRFGAFVATLFAFFMVSIAVLVLRVKDPNRKRPFRTPLIWIFAPLSALGCAFLFWNLPHDAKMVLPIWGGLGLLIYFAYGYRHSRLHGR